MALRHMLWLGLVLCVATVPDVDVSDFLELGLFFGPALLLAGCLRARRYPGERGLLRLIGSAATSRREATTRAPRCRPSRRVPRGGLLIAFALAVRPPPLAAR